MRQSIAVFTVLLGLALTGRCSHDAPPRARDVPTHVVTESASGTTVRAEQGDAIEVRLTEPGAGGEWRLSQQAGDARLTAHRQVETVASAGGRVAVFRFRAYEVGRPELTFTFHPRDDAPENRRVVTFRFVVS